MRIKQEKEQQENEGENQSADVPTRDNIKRLCEEQIEILDNQQRASPEAYQQRTAKLVQLWQSMQQFREQQQQHAAQLEDERRHGDVHMATYLAERVIRRRQNSQRSAQGPAFI